MGTYLRSNFRTGSSFAAGTRAWFGAFSQPGQSSDYKLASWPAWLLLAFFVATAVIFRAPSYLFSELNFDEALYRLMADSLLRGHAPYTEIWDRKPVGVFLILAAIQAMFGNDILALRLATSVGVGVSAFFLALLGRRIFSDAPLTGILGGFLYIAYSLRNGGDATNTELVFTPFYLAGAVLLFGSAEREGRKLLLPAFWAGLLAGIAVQIKQVVIFDILAFAAIYWITQLRGFGPEERRKFFTIALMIGLGILLPTIAAFLWYAAIGLTDTFLLSNMNAAAQIGGNALDISVQGLIDGLRQYDALVLCTGAALVIGPFLADTPERRRSWLAIVAWLLAMSMSLLFLHRFANHYFIQTLPALSMATAWFAMRAIHAMSLGRSVTRVILPVGVVLLAVWAGHSQFDAGLETVVKRGAGGVAHWGDRTATVAAALRDRLGPSDEIYVLGRTLGVYAATGRRPPTRFPFVGFLYEAYAPVDGPREIQRIVDRHPAFIIVDDLVLPSRSAPVPALDRIGTVLSSAIARDYVLDGKVSKFMSYGGGFVGGGVGVTVFRRRDLAPFKSTRALQYTPGP